MVKLFEYKHFKIILHYCYHMNSSFALSYYKCMTHLYFINRILEPILVTSLLLQWYPSDNTQQIQKNLYHNKTRLKS